MTAVRTLEKSLHGESPLAVRYGLALALATAAVALASICGPVVADPLPLLALAAVAMAALFGGAGPGFLVIALVVAWFMATAGPAIDRAGALQMVLLALVGTFVVRACGWSRAGLHGTIALRREAARRLRARLEGLRAITRAVDEGVYALDRDGRLTYLNAAAERMLGYRRSELVGLKLSEALGCARIEGTCSGQRCGILDVMATGAAYRGADEVLTRKDGTCFPVRHSSAPITRGGVVVGAAVAFQDITEERRAAQRERFLAAATERLAGSLDFEETLAAVARLALPVLGDWCMVVLVDDAGVPRRVAVESLDPARAEDARALLRAYPVDLEAAHGAGRVLRTGKPELLPEVEAFAGTGPTGLVRDALVRRFGLRSFIAVPLRVRGRIMGVMDFAISEGGRRFGAEDLALAEDLARRCALAIENARLYGQAQDAVSARDHTLAIVSHDLKNPLAAIRIAAGVIAKTAASVAPASRAAESIERATDRMSRLIGDLVDLAAMEAGRLSIQAAEICPASVAVEAAEAIRPVAEQADVRIELDLARGLSPVRGDRDRLLQVLGNLLSNAVKVSPPGGRVRLRVRAPSRAGRVVYSVSDHGPGIGPENQARIFDRYWRDANVGYSGTGLGLSIARGIVEAHGGSIWVVSSPGAGATLRFSVPLAAAADAAPEPPGEVGTAPAAAPDGSGHDDPRLELVATDPAPPRSS